MKHIISVKLCTHRQKATENHAILCKFEWGPKTTKSILGPFFSLERNRHVRGSGRIFWKQIGCSQVCKIHLKKKYPFG